MTPPQRSRRTAILRRPWLQLAAVLLIYASLVLPTITRQGISWDEQTDLAIARAYLAPNGWLIGSPADPSQTRLPMFIVALVFAIFNTTSLITARLVSVLVGGLTLVGVFIYGRRLHPLAGLLAGGLLAANPFFLAFARVAFTETDVYPACALVWLLICADRLNEQPTLGRAALVGVVLGLALSAKATMLAVVPVVWFAVGSSRGWSALARVGMIALITLLAVVTFFIVPPEHLTNPAILAGLRWRLDHEMTFNPAFLLEAAALHLLCIVFKSGPLTGAAMLLALALAVVQWPTRRAIRLPTLIVLAYGGGLLLLPLAQTFYTIPILPVLTLLLADLFTRWLAQRRKLAAALAALALVSTTVDLALCYPDFNLNGYQWVGARVIAGRPTLGYRSVVQTPSDGVEQVFQWLNAHAAPGARVRAYVLPWHIVQAAAPNPHYAIANGFKDHSPNPDYVVIEVNALIPQSWWTRRKADTASIFDPPYDPAWLEQQYVKVYAVRRAFGIEMASVWQKK